MATATSRRRSASWAQLTRSVGNVVWPLAQGAGTATPAAACPAASEHKRTRVMVPRSAEGLVPDKMIASGRRSTTFRRRQEEISTPNETGCHRAVFGVRRVYSGSGAPGSLPRGRLRPGAQFAGAIAFQRQQTLDPPRVSRRFVRRASGSASPSASFSSSLPARGSIRTRSATHSPGSIGDPCLALLLLYGDHHSRLPLARPAAPGARHPDA